MDNIPYEEAVARFKVGHHFRISKKIGERSVFLPGDIVSLKDFYEFSGTWGIHCEFVERVPGPRMESFGLTGLAIHSTYLEEINPTPSCTCDIFYLMRAACACGAFQRELRSQNT
jgi:hypothetical protein